MSSERSILDFLIIITIYVVTATGMIGVTTLFSNGMKAPKCLSKVHQCSILVLALAKYFRLRRS